MKSAWQRFLAMLTPGVRVLLCLLVAIYLAEFIGRTLRVFDLSHWLALSGSTFWSGQVWRIATFVLLPLGILNFLMNCVALVILGGLLERHWSRGQLWLYCLVATLGAGSAMVILQFSSPAPLSGAAPMVFGLLIAWGFLCRHEIINVLVFGEVTVWKLVLIAAAISFITVFLTAGMVMALVMAAGGLAGLLYLWLKHKWLMSRASCVAHSDRINRLEL